MPSKHPRNDPYGIYHKTTITKSFHQSTDKPMPKTKKQKRKLKKQKEKARKEEKKEKKRLKMAEETIKSVPRVLIFQRGQPIGKLLKELILNLRDMMQPFTTQPKSVVSKKAPIKSLLTIAKQVYISHFIVVSLTNLSPVLKICRVPQGPTVYFRIKEYTTCAAIREFSQQTGVSSATMNNSYRSLPAMVVMNGFKNLKETDHKSVVAMTLKKMFPAIDVSQFQTKNRRCVLFENDEESNCIYMRHYAVKMEENPEDENKYKVDMIEIGPRLTLELYKIESEVFRGEVLYHKVFEKSEKENKSLAQKHVAAAKQKQKRIRVQNKNVERKKAEREEKSNQQKEKRDAKLKKMMESATKEILEENDEQLKSIEVAEEFDLTKRKRKRDDDGVSDKKRVKK